MTDEMIAALGKKGGVIQINYLNSYIDEPLRLAEEARRPQVDAIRKAMAEVSGPENAEKRMMETIAAVGALQPPPGGAVGENRDHIDHAVKIAVSTTSVSAPTSTAPRCPRMEDVTRLPKITEELLRRATPSRRSRDPGRESPAPGWRRSNRWRSRSRQRPFRPADSLPRAIPTHRQPYPERAVWVL
jgi:microsomal dipeptidase-like Zn-dependent dipeptidase